jgi:hypothetical protein
VSVRVSEGFGQMIKSAIGQMSEWGGVNDLIEWATELAGDWGYPS